MVGIQKEFEGVHARLLINFDLMKSQKFKLVKWDVAEEHHITELGKVDFVASQAVYQSNSSEFVIRRLILQSTLFLLLLFLLLFFLQFSLLLINKPLRNLLLFHLSFVDYLKWLIYGIINLVERDC